MDGAGCDGARWQSTPPRDRDGAAAGRRARARERRWCSWVASDAPARLDPPVRTERRRCIAGAASRPRPARPAPHVEVARLVAEPRAVLEAARGGRHVRVGVVRRQRAPPAHVDDDARLRQPLARVGGAGAAESGVAFNDNVAALEQLDDDDETTTIALARRRYAAALMATPPKRRTHRDGRSACAFSPLNSRSPRPPRASPSAAARGWK